jgi:hypothetical protein
MKYVHLLLMDHTKEAQKALSMVPSHSKVATLECGLFLNGLDHCSVVRDPFYIKK